jgi:hypothetical protein
MPRSPAHAGFASTIIHACAPAGMIYLSSSQLTSSTTTAGGIMKTFIRGLLRSTVFDFICSKIKGETYIGPFLLPLMNGIFLLCLLLFHLSR